MQESAGMQKSPLETLHVAIEEIKMLKEEP